jgi:hypothetical protein
MLFRDGGRPIIPLLLVAAAASVVEAAAAISNSVWAPAVADCPSVVSIFILPLVLLFGSAAASAVEEGCAFASACSIPLRALMIALYTSSLDSSGDNGSSKEAIAAAVLLVVLLIFVVMVVGSLVSASLTTVELLLLLVTTMPLL